MKSQVQRLDQDLTMTAEQLKVAGHFSVTGESCEIMEVEHGGVLKLSKIIFVLWLKMVDALPRQCWEKMRFLSILHHEM